MRFIKLFLVGCTTIFVAISPVANAKPLRVALSDDATSLDPHVGNIAINNRLLNNIYEGLVRRDKDFNIAPSLAVSWSQPDAKTWRFKLRPGVTFHDGSAFSADDVVFSAARAQNALSSFKASLQGVGAVKKIDEMTVDFIMAEPNPIMLLHLVSFQIMSKSWSTKHGVLLPQNYGDKEETFASRSTNGTGPFMLVSRAPDVKTVLIENKNWWNRAAAERGNVSAIEWTPIKSNGTRIAALMSGSIDFVPDPPNQDRERLKKTAGVTLQVGSEPRVLYLALDQSRDTLLYSNIKGKNPFKDHRVRQAMAYAIDSQLIINKVTRGYGRPTGLVVGRGALGYAAEMDRPTTVDIPRAKALMAQAGYGGGGFEVTMDCVNQTPFAEVCLAITPMLASIGITVKLNMVSFTNIFPKLRKFDTSFYVMDYGTATMDAYFPLEAILNSVGASGSGRGDGNWGRYANPKVDALLARIKVEMDAAKRNALIAEVLTIARDDVAVIPIYQTTGAWGARKNIDAPYAPNSYWYFYRFKVN